MCAFAKAVASQENAAVVLGLAAGRIDQALPGNKIDPDSETPVCRSGRFMVWLGPWRRRQLGHGGLLYDAIVFPLLLKGVYDDKDVQEWIIRSSGLDWTIMRPGLLTNSPATGRYRVLRASKEWRFGAISRADAADFLVPDRRPCMDWHHAASH